jgi:hypothetical protein
VFERRSSLSVLSVLVVAGCIGPADAEESSATTEQHINSGIPRPRYDVILRAMDDLARTHPEWVAVVDYGLSQNGLTLRAVRIAAPGSLNAPGHPAVLITGATHGHEFLGLEDDLPAWFVAHRSSDPGVKRFFDASGALYVIPVFNPDGFESGRRENANGVDLNRDYSDTPTQPETSSLTRWLATEMERSQAQLRVAFDYHCCRGGLIYPDELTPAELEEHRLIAQFMLRDISQDYVYGTAQQVVGYSAKNDSATYFRGRFGSLSFGMEGRVANATFRGEVLERHAMMWSDILEHVAATPARKR